MKLKIATIIIFVLAALLLIVSFLLPPMGVIDPSVIRAVGELMGMAGMLLLWHAIDKGIDAKFKHGDTTIELTNDDN